jgi:hypothetical protein
MVLTAIARPSSSCLPTMVLEVSISKVKWRVASRSTTILELFGNESPVIGGCPMRENEVDGQSSSTAILELVVGEPLSMVSEDSTSRRNWGRRHQRTRPPDGYQRSGRSVQQYSHPRVGCRRAIVDGVGDSEDSTSIR